MLVTAANKLDFRTSVFPVHVYHRASAVIIEVTLNLLFDTRRRFLWNIVFITIIRSIGYFVHQYAFGRKIQVHPGRYAVCRAGDADNIDNGHTLAATGPDDLLAFELIHLTSTGPSFGFGIFAGIETFPDSLRKCREVDIRFGHSPLSVCIFEPCRIVGPGFRPGSLEEKVRHSIVASKGPSYILGTRITSVKSRQYLLRNM